MEATAQVRHLRVTAQKARRVVDLARGGVAADVVASLRFQPQAVAEPVRKVIESAMANAKVKADEAGERLDDSDLLIKEIYVDEGPTMKRIRPRAQGRAARILKRSCHITVVVATRDVATKEGAR